MSYTPTIIIKKADLDKHADKFERDWEWYNDKELDRVMVYLRFVYKKHTVAKIDGIELLICEPELSSFNKQVRDKLQEWEVQYDLFD